MTVGNAANLGTSACEWIAQLAQTPGVILIKLEAMGCAISRRNWTAKVFEVSSIPDVIKLPTGITRVRISAFGGFEPIRPTDTSETLLAEINRERKAAGADSLPRDTKVKSLGFDDLGFLSFQIIADLDSDDVEPFVSDDLIESAA
jgi:hypothetical protein